MTIAPGTRVGPYEITGSLGAGGMGEVYRARDTKLARDVAIKILPRLFTSDPDRLARFEREARVLASLNHPHIGAIYGLDAIEGMPALVLELVDGSTLAELIAAGPLRVADALTIATQIAEALDAAHERGIVHRDLKPANIKVTLDGRVKVLDFGLAKPGAGETGTQLTHSPTMTLGGTRDGVLLGTAAYMSPEQARGKPMDKRTDIWAFGCVLYEMITGHAAFAGETLTDTLAAIVERDPDWRALPEATPSAIRRVLKRCLEKDLKRRLRDIGDVSLELQESVEPEPSRRVASPQVLYRRLTDLVGMNESPAVSPDGKMIAFVARVQGTRQIWIRLLASGLPLQITRDHEDHEQPRWLPDSSALIYYTPSTAPGEPGVLCEIAALGGPSRPLLSATGGCDISHDGRYLAFFRTRQHKLELMVAPRHGAGEERVVASLSDPVCDSLRWSPDGRWLAFLGESDDHFQQRLCIVAADGGEVRDIVRGTFLKGCSWLPDSSGLVYSSSAGSTVPYPPKFNLRAVGRDGSSDRQLTYGHVSYVQPDVHATGTILACCVGVGSNIWKFPTTGTPADNTRDAVRITDQTGQVQTPSASPDGRELVFLSDSGGHGNLWVMALGSGAMRQLTFERDTGATIGAPTWSPSGRHIAFILSRGDTALWLINPDGRNLRRIVERGYAACWSRDGRSLYYSTAKGDLLTTMKLPIDGGPPEAVPGEQISRVSVGDSSALYYPARLRPELGGWDWEIRFIPAGGGLERALAHIPGSRVPLSPAFVHLHLSSDEQSLAMALVDGATSNLWILPTAGGPMRQVTDFGDRPTLIARQVSWSPDSQYLYAAVAETNADVVLLDGLL